MKVTVAGGSGYIGALLCAELIGQGHQVTALDALIHGQDDVAAQIEAEGVDLIRADIRDAGAREKALTGSDAVVHLAAIVGDPACARDPELSEEVNVEGSHLMVEDAKRLGVERVVFASTCSNYGRMADPTTPIDETGELRPVSLYAEQKVGIEKMLLGDKTPGFSATCLRFATVYGVAPRMRFDLTVNEFTRDLWAERRLDVFGELFWRPYIHVADAARAAALVLSKPTSEVAGEVFNAGHSDENYRKLDLVELILERLGRGDVEYVSRDEDPRDYKVSFEKIKTRLGFAPRMRVPDGIDEIVNALEADAFADAFASRYSNIG
jgi:nucleoside-diphosphate-sugar epimerase